MKSFRGFIVLLLPFFCNIMVHAQKVYNGVMTGTSPHGILITQAGIWVRMKLSDIKHGWLMMIQEIRLHYKTL